jgi:hypothetical protein
VLRTALSWLIVLLGLWIAAAPFVLNYRTVEPAFTTSVIAGLAVAVLAFVGWLLDAGALKRGKRRPADSAHAA